MATKKRKAAPADAIAVLKKDHEKVRGLLSQLERAAERNTAKARSRRGGRAIASPRNEMNSPTYPGVLRATRVAARHCRLIPPAVTGTTG